MAKYIHVQGVFLFELASEDVHKLALLIFEVLGLTSLQAKNINFEFLRPTIRFAKGKNSIVRI